MNGAKLRPALLAAAANRGDGGILSGKIFCRDCRSGSRSLECDIDGIEDCERRTVLGIADDNPPLNGRQPVAFAVARIIRVKFGDNVILVAWQEPGLDVQTALRRFHS